MYALLTFFDFFNKRNSIFYHDFISIYPCSRGERFTV